MDEAFQRYLDWLREHWQVTLDPAGAEEQPPVDPATYRAFNPLGGTVKDHATKLLLDTIQKNTGFE